MSTARVDPSWIEAQQSQLREVISPTITNLIEDTEHPDETTIVALGLLAEVASLCLYRIIGVPGRGSISSVAAMEPRDALWCLEAIANLRCDEIMERSTVTLSLPHRDDP